MKPANPGEYKRLSTFRIGKNQSLNYRGRYQGRLLFSLIANDFSRTTRRVFDPDTDPDPDGLWAKATFVWRLDCRI